VKQKLDVDKLIGDNGVGEHFCSRTVQKGKKQKDIFILIGYTTLHRINEKKKINTSD
jgi:hypothetical protein